MFRWIVLVACVFAALLGLAVGVMNPDAVSTRLPGLELDIALGSLLVIVFSAGVIAGFLLFAILFHLPARLTRKGDTPADGKKGQLPERNA
jgi:uncharacterized membrane protein YciS (DUF1049 family)